jgi:hypothetical protein
MAQLMSFASPFAVFVSCDQGGSMPSTSFHEGLARSDAHPWNIPDLVVDNNPEYAIISGNDQKQQSG